MYNLVSQQRCAAMLKNIISVQCKNCKMMELSSDECAVLAMPNDEYFFVFNCPDCRNNSQARKLNKLQAAYWQDKGVKLFYVPNQHNLKYESNDETYINIRCAICGTIRVAARRCHIEENALGQTCLYVTCPNCNTETEKPIDGASKESYMKILQESGVQHRRILAITEEEISEFAAQLADANTDIIEEVKRII